MFPLRLVAHHDNAIHTDIDGLPLYTVEKWIQDGNGAYQLRHIASSPLKDEYDLFGAGVDMLASLAKVIACTCAVCGKLTYTVSTTENITRLSLCADHVGK